MTVFCSVAKEKFAFLVEEFDFSLVDEAAEPWGGEIVYRSGLVGIRVTYEAPSAFVFVRIYRLVEGEMRENPSDARSVDDVTYIYMQDALSEAFRMRPAYEYGEDSAYYDEENGLETFVSEFASRLKRHCRGLLEGDFSSFEMAAKILIARLTQR